jgi:RNA polymerase sigma factor for flagellar operon FliA
VGADESRLERTILRISTIESTSPLANLETMDGTSLPAVLVPSEPPAPDRLFEQTETRDRVRAALAQLPARERRIIGLYYFGDVTMKQIGEQIGVNESRVSQLHARAIQRLRRLLSPAPVPAPKVDVPAVPAAPRLVAKTTRPRLARAAARRKVTPRRVRPMPDIRRAVA